MKNIKVRITHHGATRGVTGSCHRLELASGAALLVDCGLFQGAEREGDDEGFGFDPGDITALVITHCHIDHVGRLPHLIAAGFRGPIYCSEATAVLLPLVLEDALKIGVTRDARLIEGFLGLIGDRLRPLPYGEWREIERDGDGDERLSIRLQPAGHILGSAYVECRVEEDGQETRVLFSGDLGAPDTPLLPSPVPPEGTDILVLESTYGDRLHEDRTQRSRRLRELVERCLRDSGTILIPAFSIGRTQELLYELEGIIHDCGEQAAGAGRDWDEMEIILDSPLAARFTESYRRLRPLWDAEARERVEAGRHPLAFDQLYTIDSHDAHRKVVEALASSGRPSIVIAASGMCAGGRIVNYLKALLGDPRTDVLFVGYQAAGTPGRDIQQYGPRGGYVVLDGERYDIRAQVHTLGGYSAHADRDNLIDFVRGMREKPREVRLVHGEQEAKESLAEGLRELLPGAEIVIPC